MPKERLGTQRDGFTPQGTQRSFDRIYSTIRAPRFVAKARRPHYLLVRKVPKRGWK